MAGIVVKPRARIFHGHEWVYGNEVKKLFGSPQPGDVVSLKDFKDRPLGSAIYNPESQIVARRFSRRKQELDQDFFVRRLRRAQKYRQRLGFDHEPSVYRLAWSESDGLPGLIVDRYGDQVVIQTLTLAMDQRKEVILEAIREVLDPECVVERNDNSIRAAEGMKPVKNVLLGKPRTEAFTINNVSLTVDVWEGQKTGLYLDQLGNYRAVAAHAKDRRVLDCFCNQAGFALHAVRAGAESARAVDSSDVALDAANANAERSGLDIQLYEANVFDYLKHLDNEGERYDLIVLDPPSFTRNRKGLKDALRGYKEIHLRALKLLNKGGLLATFSCSHHMGREVFLDMIRDAAVDAKRTLRLVETYRQREDHPVLAGIPESDYLCGFLLENIPAW